MKRRLAFLSHMILSILFYSLCQNLYAQSQISNTTLQLYFNTTIATKNSINELSPATNSSHKLRVVSSFFPIDEFVKKIGGDMIQSSILIPTGIEPHDFEPTINQIQTVDSADVLVYNGLGIDNWITKINTAHKIDASEGLNASYTDRRNMTLDPHVWLDPLLAKKEVENIRDGLMTIDPNNRDRYFNNAKNFLNVLDNLDKNNKN